MCFLYETKYSNETLIEGVDYFYKNGMRHDVKEKDPKYKDVIEKAFFEAEEELVEWIYPMYDIPLMQKKILKERYCINWRTFYELNAERKFD